MKKIDNFIKQKICGGKISKISMFEGIISLNLVGGVTNSALSLINQIIFYSKAENLKLIPDNFKTPNTYLKIASNPYYSSIGMLGL